ncbi:hypothetical protein EVAR_88265_1 [Eumeta japonica]|uniref:Uncharacterized protein n=1 Tax=Eumeta variegata TaxID=151549 RepID=A0A4C1XMI7_EUMVA|nr:hypothetical protein EVAR_88265_1 [Eumeta japonica]
MVQVLRAWTSIQVPTKKTRCKTIGLRKSKRGRAACVADFLPYALRKSSRLNWANLSLPHSDTCSKDGCWLPGLKAESPLVGLRKYSEIREVSGGAGDARPNLGATFPYACVCSAPAPAPPRPGRRRLAGVCPLPGRRHLRNALRNPLPWCSAQRGQSGDNHGECDTCVGKNVSEPAHVGRAPASPASPTCARTSARETFATSTTPGARRHGRAQRSAWTHSDTRYGRMQTLS